MRGEIMGASVEIGSVNSCSQMVWWDLAFVCLYASILGMELRFLF